MDLRMTRRGWLATLPVVAPAIALARPATAQEAGGDGMVGRVLGDPAAPVTIIEYASLSCPHCASFHEETLPELKEAYIDTGQAKLVYRDFPLNQAALVGSKVAHCAGDQFFQFLDVLFANQRQWAAQSDPAAAIKPLARLGGLSNEEVDACLADQALENRILEMRLMGQNEHNVNSTPTFVIGGQTISGAQPFDTFAAAIEQELQAG